MSSNSDSKDGINQMLQTEACGSAMRYPVWKSKGSEGGGWKEGRRKEKPTQNVKFNFDLCHTSIDNNNAQLHSVNIPDIP